MSFRQIPFMAFAALFYFILVSLAGLKLGDPLFSIPMPSGVGLALNLGDLIVVVTLVLSFVGLLSASSATSTAIISHGLQLLVFLVCLFLLLLAPSFGTSTFLLITLMTLINTVAGYSVSILRARRDFSLDRTMS